MNYYIIVFKNTLDAMTGEKKMNELGFNFRMMPTPTTITQSCGICIRIEDVSVIDEVINNNLIEFKSIYKRDSEGYTVIK